MEKREKGSNTVYPSILRLLGSILTLTVNIGKRGGRRKFWGRYKIIKGGLKNNRLKGTLFSPGSTGRIVINNSTDFFFSSKF